MNVLSTRTGTPPATGPTARSSFDHVPHSGAEGIVWPAPPTQGAAVQLSLLFQLEQTQWWPRPLLQQWQFAQLSALVDHAYRTVPFYRDRLDAIGYDAGTTLDDELWSRLPVLERSEVQAAGAALDSSDVPAAHGAVSGSATSGSTGTPVRVNKTRLAGVFWVAFGIREHLWHRNDLNQKLAAIREPEALNLSEAQRRAAHEGGLAMPRWAEPTGQLFHTGPSLFLSVLTPIERQVKWLQREQPVYLATFPSNARFLAEHCIEHGIALPNLQRIFAVGEVVTDDVRRACKAAWDARVIGTYSSVDAGILALQCPENDYYHVQSEGVLVEVLNEAGRPCTTGEVGRVVATNLHNFATPLLRYALGDYAEVGPPSCSCGRGLPVLKRVLGRQRNMLRLPSGSGMWPDIHGADYREFAPVKRFQLAQTALDELELRLVVERPLTADEEAKIRGHLQARLPEPFTIRLTYHEALRPDASGKYEDFKSELAT